MHSKTQDGGSPARRDSRMRATLLEVLCLGLVFLTGCSLFQAQDPPIDDETLVNVLVELHMLEARADLDYDIEEHRRDSIFALYNITEDEFDQTVAFYAHRPEKYLFIYRDVLEIMNQEEMRMRDQLREN